MLEVPVQEDPSAIGLPPGRRVRASRAPHGAPNPPSPTQPAAEDLWSTLQDEAPAVPAEAAAVDGAGEEADVEAEATPKIPCARNE